VPEAGTEGFKRLRGVRLLATNAPTTANTIIVGAIPTKTTRSPASPIRASHTPAIAMMIDAVDRLHARAGPLIVADPPDEATTGTARQMQAVPDALLFERDLGRHP
jgi:hypothetical protein